MWDVLRLWVCVSESERVSTHTCVHVHIRECVCVCFGVRVVWPLSVWQAWSAEITPRLPSLDSCCWVALNARFCNYKSVIILPVFSFSPGAKRSVRHRHSAVLQLHLHTRPRGRPPTHKRVPTHTHAETNADTFAISHDESCCWHWCWLKRRAAKRGSAQLLL